MTTLRTLGFALASLAGVAFGPSVASARPLPPRAVHQARRVDAAAAQGDLTPHEAGYLRRRQSEIAQYERDALREKGYVTPYERERIHVERNEQSRQIEHLRHNDDRR